MTARSDQSRDGAGAPQRAAQYLRMSTDHQRYSLENQSAAIRTYAEIYGLTVIRTFVDAGKSGLTFEGRAGLKALIAEIVDGVSDYEVLLVYDVSRWGRFQDVDEGAYYEFLCRRAGLKVVYVAEKFENDTSGMASILKTLKRVMASEYSRDLSARVFYAQCRVVRRGYRAGSSAGLGLRRLLIDARGMPKIILEKGQRKAIQGERIILVPGPPAEIAAVRDIFRMFTRDRLSLKATADALNAADHPASLIQLWSPHTVGNILRNEKYIGHNVYGKKSTKLKSKMKRNPRDEWVIAEDAFEPIIDKTVFQEAQVYIARYRPTKEILLEHLRRIWGENGELTATLIRSCRGGHGLQIYRQRFGSLTNAYDLIGYDYQKLNYPYRRRRKAPPHLLREVLSTLEDRLQWEREGRGGRVFSLPGGDRVAFRTMLGLKRSSGTIEWRFKLRWPRGAIFIILARTEADNPCVRDFILLPRAEFSGRCLTITQTPSERFRPYTYKDLTTLLEKGLGIQTAFGGR